VDSKVVVRMVEFEEREKRKRFSTIDEKTGDVPLGKASDSLVSDVSRIISQSA